MFELSDETESESSDLPTFDELEASDMFTPEYVSF